MTMIWNILKRELIYLLFYFEIHDSYFVMTDQAVSNTRMMPKMIRTVLLTA